MAAGTVGAARTVEQVQAATGWELKTAARVGAVPPPGEEELRLLREDAYPDRVYLR